MEFSHASFKKKNVAESGVLRSPHDKNLGFCVLHMIRAWHRRIAKNLLFPQMFLFLIKCRGLLSRYPTYGIWVYHKILSESFASKVGATATLKEAGV
jgi:hypothetical protein